MEKTVSELIRLLRNSVDRLSKEPQVISGSPDQSDDHRSVAVRKRNRSESESGTPVLDANRREKIPRFYNKCVSAPAAPSVCEEEDSLSVQPNELQLKFLEEARNSYLHQKTKELSGDEALGQLYPILMFNQTKMNEMEEDSQSAMINFVDFLKAKGEVNEAERKFFTSTNFAKIFGVRHDVYGRIFIMDFFNYVMRKNWHVQTRIGLSLYDTAGLGFLCESDLENYIQELIPTLPQLNCMETSFHSFYVCTAVRKFFFFLDPSRTGKLRILDVQSCGFLDDVLQLRESEELPKNVLDANWFSAQSALRVYAQYLALDLDHNGMLSHSELAEFGVGALTTAFVDRVFQECLTYVGEMDYKTYLDFVLAMENKREPQSIQYLFRILDSQNCGYLDTFTLNYYYRSMLEKQDQMGYDQVKFLDIQNDIFDMVKPAEPGRITLEDLLKCGMGHTLLGLLTDYREFWKYENRENLMASADGKPAED